MNSIYTPKQAVITKIIEETPTIKTLVLKPEEEFSFSTGQFIELTYPGKGEAPFTPSSDPNKKEEFEVTIMKVGRITALFHQAKVGQILGLRGPLGKGYPLDSFVGKELLIVGGGVGLAPLRSLIYALFSRIEDFKKIIICYGAKTPQDIVYKYQIEEFKKPENVELRLTVDKADQNWQGNVGVVTTLLDNLPLNSSQAVSVVCGPPIMMKFTTWKLLESGFLEENIYLSMEKNMSCGLGKCGHCRLGRFYVCKDGPVFKYSEIKDIEDIWD
ncbi:MAG TPA: oxidoreductase [Candidatus Omnitrophica bacterium]|nr:MAG: oxidoreductase [Candidatus Omnitrophota bacterium]RKY35746.1 MAG: oxidoreductase [Candidatus Omnitrophota bacterium]RKY44595.1 MAG: oxidoreductase [Candidatus Omnitrophota bacterium]HEC69984.1 oxidoreductase [Candidatus Omnitrophota bacterium]